MNHMKETGKLAELQKNGSAKPMTTCRPRRSPARNSFTNSPDCVFRGGRPPPVVEKEGLMDAISAVINRRRMDDPLDFGHRYRLRVVAGLLIARYGCCACR